MGDFSVSNENYEKVVKQCKEYIKTEFESCGLKDDVERRIFELVQEWEKRQAEAEKRGEKIGGLGVIFIDVERAVWKADADSKRFGTRKCKYFRRWLSLPFTKSGGLGYWALQMWK